jgi:ubiquinone/menaquinone biosynthesis C-methylase UbiE
VPRVDYRECHLHDDAAQAYHDVYAAGYYAAQWRQLERPWLSGLFAELAAAGSRRMLDIACGQGRITLLAANHFPHVLGIDVSNSMLTRARQAIDDDTALSNTDVRFEIADVRTFTAEQPFDVVTAFRFFLNAEDDLRIDGLRCARRNISPNGTFIASVQCSGTCPLSLFYRVSNTTRRLFAKRVSSVRNALTVIALRKMFVREGFRIDRVHRYSLLPRIGSLTDTIAERSIATFDRVGNLVPGVRLMSQAFIVCARPI